MLWLIIGPTCAGKSYFIRGKRFSDISRIEHVREFSPSSFGKIGASIDLAFHYNTFRQDHDIWNKLLSRRVDRQAFIIVTDRETLELRMSKRGGYPRGVWLKKLESTDLTTHYNEWAGLLDVKGIPYKLLDGRTTFNEIASLDDVIRN